MQTRPEAAKEIALDPRITHSLEARCYIDPEIFRRETGSVLARTWRFAGHAGKLKRPGDYFALELAGESLFCIKGPDGEIRTFYNVCQHRAHPHVRGSGNAPVLVCPCHP